MYKYTIIMYTCEVVTTDARLHFFDVFGDLLWKLQGRLSSPAHAMQVPLSRQT